MKINHWKANQYDQLINYINPDDGKLPKTFGLNFFNFTNFNFFSLVYKIHDYYQLPHLIN